MSVRFVIGRAGSGKTHALREALVEHVLPDPLNRGVIYLVPKQATFNTQRAIAADPRLNGFCNLRVIAPDDLAEVVLVETDHPAGARLDAIGRSLVLGHLLRENVAALKHFDRSAGRPGLAREIDRAFREFERAGRDMAEIDALIDVDASGNVSVEASQQTLARKLADLKLIYLKYQDFLKGHGFDPFQRQLLVPEAIAKWPEARGALLLVDDFYDYTAYERQLIAALARAAQETRIAVLMDPNSPLVNTPDLVPDEFSLFHRTESAYRQLHFALRNADVTPTPPILLHKAERWPTPLRAIEGVLDPHPPSPVKEPAAVRLLLTADARDELHTAAREIRRLLRSGYRLREIAVLARSIDGYSDAIDAIFAEHQIPFFLDRRRPAQHHPLVKTLQAILQIIQSRWSHDSVFDLLKAGLTRQDESLIDLLQVYVVEHRLLASCWRDAREWTFARSQFDDVEQHSLFTPEEINLANKGRVFVSTAIGAIGDPAWMDSDRPLRERMTDLFAALERLHVRESMLDRIKTAAGNPSRIEQYEEDQQIWTEWIDLADRLTELLGDSPMTGQAFADLLQTALGELELAIIPPTIDQVLVGTIDRTRTGPIRAAILIGMNECQFPLCERERAILNDADRHHLLRRGIEVEPPSRDALMMERFLGYLALTRASDSITLIRMMNDRDGNAQQSSPYWDAVCAVFPRAEVQMPADSIERIATPEQAVSHVITWARRSPNPADESAGLYQWLATEAGDGARKVRDRAWPSLRYDNHATLSPDNAAKLFASPLEASVSRFESFAACPFQHYARYGLRLQRPTEQEFTAMDLGNLYHAVLETVVADALQLKLDFATAHQVTAEQIRVIARDVGQSLSNQVFLSSARNRFTLDQLESTVHKLVQAQQFQLGSGEFRPAFTELTFGDRKRLPAVELTTPNRHTVKLRGKIDRVDLAGDVFSVVDYKLGGKTLDYTHVAHGLMLQLLTYLLVLKQHGESLTNRPLTPAAALYVKVLRSLTNVDHPSEAPEPETDPFHTKEKPRGLIRGTQVTRFDAAMTSGGVSKVVSVKIKKDGTFYESGNDAVDGPDFDALVRFVEQQIVRIADTVIAGEIAVDPYIIGKETACAQCDLRRVCRFDRAINGYHQLTPYSRSEALEMIRNEAGGASDGD